MQRILLGFVLFAFALVITWLIVLALSLIPQYCPACLRQQEKERDHATDA